MPPLVRAGFKPARTGRDCTPWGIARGKSGRGFCFVRSAFLGNLIECRSEANESRNRQP